MMILEQQLDTHIGKKKKKALQTYNSTIRTVKQKHAHEQLRYAEWSCDRLQVKLQYNFFF